MYKQIPCLSPFMQIKVYPNEKSGKSWKYFSSEEQFWLSICGNTGKFLEILFICEVVLVVFVAIKFDLS